MAKAATKKTPAASPDPVPPAPEATPEAAPEEKTRKTPLNLAEKAQKKLQEAMDTLESLEGLNGYPRARAAVAAYVISLEAIQLTDRMRDSLLNRGFKMIVAQEAQKVEKAMEQALKGLTA